MSFVTDAIGRWIQSLGTPPADFTTDQIRRILHDIAGLREYRVTDDLPAGFIIRTRQSHIYVTWDHNREHSPTYAHRATAALNGTGYRGHFAVVPEQGNNGVFLAIQVPTTAKTGTTSSPTPWRFPAPPRPRAGRAGWSPPPTGDGHAT